MLYPSTVSSWATWLKLFFRARFKSVVAVCLVLAELGFNAAFAPSWTVLVVLAVVPATTLAWDAYDRVQERRLRVRRNPLPEIAPESLSTLSSEWTILHHAENERGSLQPKRTQAIFSEDANRFLWKDPIEIETSDSVFVPPLNPRFIYTIVYGQDRAIRCNEQTVRQTDDIDRIAVDRETTVSLQCTEYVAGLVTNDFTEKCLLDEGPPLISYVNGHDVLFAPNNKVHTLRSSPASNHIGISTLVVMRDNVIPIVVQTPASAQSGGLFAPSGSGSMEFNRDLRSQKPPANFQDLLAHSMKRELIEECGLSEEVVACTFITGHARLLHRGGKPEYFGISVADVDHRYIQKRREERPFVHGHLFRSIPSKSIDALINWFDSELSLSARDPQYSIILRLNLLLAKAFIVANDRLVEDQLGYR